MEIKLRNQINALKVTKTEIEKYSKITSYVEKLLEKEQKTLQDSESNLANLMVPLFVEYFFKKHEDYFANKISKFPTLNKSYYFENKSDTDTISLSNFFVDLLNFMPDMGRVLVVMPAQGFPKKELISFIKEIEILDLEFYNVRKTGLHIFIQQITHTKGDKAKYVCFMLSLKK